MSMDTLLTNDDQCSSSVMEIETAIATPVREVETGINPDCGTEITKNLQDSLIEAKMEIPAAETDLDKDENKLNAAEVKHINHLYEGIKYQSIAVVSVSESKELKKLDHCLQKYKELLAERSPTTTLWLQYIEYVETLKVFIRAERTGDWNLYIVAITKMLYLFAATVSSFKYLGVMLSTNFTWTDHIEYISSKINKNLGLLRRIKHLLPHQARLLFYNSLVLPIFDYVDLVWGDKDNLVLMADAGITSRLPMDITLLPRTRIPYSPQKRLLH
ncbi:Hypothetical predicted protein [Paramuricea clavata]|uniref:Uncharacterized protein n=1 Tax=Paramuricea clavata TaxID=317549 RepID=A0A7D9E513_PARCT|nr:Hypothetical predicted protein [Paramuricea clavata]